MRYGNYYRHQTTNHKRYTAEVNCFKNLTSFSLKRRISLIPYFNNAGRSIPMPNAKPVYLFGSMPQLERTFGCTIPLPSISSQPVFLQTLQPAPLHSMQLISISALGSVNGKYEGRKR